MKFDVVVNPAGASGRTGREFKELLPKIESYGHEIKVHYSTKEHGIEQLVREITEAEEPVRLIVMGGDGTLNEAVNGIRDLDLVELGVLTAGSGNDFARSIGLEKDREKLIDTIMQGKVQRRIDVGEVTYHSLYRPSREGDDKNPVRVDEKTTSGADVLRRRFTTSSGLGFDAKTCYAVSISKMKPILNKIHLGKLVYLVAAVGAIFGAPRTNMTLTYPDGRQEVYEHCLLSVAMNEIYEGGGFAFCPDADDKDGKLDLCIANPKNNVAFFRIFPFVYLGSHFKKFPSIIHGGCTGEIHMQSQIPLWVHTDGETPYMSDDVTMKIIDKKLKLLV